MAAGYVEVRFKMKPEKFAVYEAEANKIKSNTKWPVKVSAISLIKAEVDKSADAKLQHTNTQTVDKPTGKPIYNSFGEVTGYE